MVGIELRKTRKNLGIEMGKIITLIIIASSFLVACDDGKRLPKRSSGVVCPSDVHMCPDGNYVSRNPDNSCEFDSCSSGGISANECQSKGGCAPQINLPPE